MRLDAPARIALTYAVVSLVYIFLSDWLVSLMVTDVMSGLVQTIKGSGFVALSASLIYILMRAELRRQDQLRLVATQAQRLEAIGQLTTVMAHDFNNLLTIIIGSLEMIDDELSPEQKDRLPVNMALRAAENGGKLTRQMLVFARQGHTQTHMVDVNDSASQMSPLLSLATGESVSLRLELADDLPVVRAEPVQLANILLNLIINARDAMPRGGEIRVTTQRTQLGKPLTEGQWSVPAGDYVVISVRDTGDGISVGDMANVLTPFFTTKPVGQGTGLGLTMMRDSLRQWSGHVVITSARNLGTTVSMYLPATTGTKELEPSRRLPPSVRESNSGQTVLLVENDPDVRQAVAQQLRRLGYRVLPAASGPEAMQILETAPRIDMLLSDIILDSKVTGVKLARHARRKDPQVKVILMSGYADPTLTAEMADFAALGWLGKPFDRSDLQREMRRLLEKPDH